MLKNLTAAIKSDGSFDLSQVNKYNISVELRKFKTDGGGINYPSLFSIPNKERIHEMSKVDFDGTVQVLSVSVKLALESFNLKRPLTNNQIFDLVEAVIDESGSDNLALEDLLLFLQQLTRGEYGDMYESMDVPKFMQWFGEYRDKRWEAGVKIRDEKHEEFKRLGDDNYHERANRVSPIDEELLKYTQKRQEQKDEIALLKKENEILKRRNE